MHSSMVKVSVSEGRVTRVYSKSASHLFVNFVSTSCICYYSTLAEDHV